MEKLKEINIEDYKTTTDKISLSNKNNDTEKLSVLKCYRNLEEILTLEAKNINLIKTHKTVSLNLINLQNLDLRENKLCKISKSFIILKFLKSLKLDSNNITFIPNFIGEFDKLEIFTITNNKLTYLPSSIQNLQKLKQLKLSNNMIQALPIEFGLLKSIECLHIDANYFTEIPTTFCYLKHLSDLAFEWLEFLDPPFQKNIKENIGKTIISLIRNSLQEMVKQNILFCDFSTFIEKNSNNTSRKDSDKINNENSNNNINNNVDSLNSSDFNEHKRINTKALNTNENIDMEKNLIKVNSYKDRVNNSNTKEGILLTLSNIKNTKFFYAIDNNYYGVIKSILFSNCEITKIKNIDNKTPLYYSIHHSKIDITNLFLTKVDLFNISNAYIYLHKAIRMRDPILTMKLIDLGVDPNNADDQGIFNLYFIKNY